MTTANVKSAIFEKVKALSSNDAKKVYGMMLEYDVNASLFQSFDEIPSEHKRLVKKGLSDLKRGRMQNANQFIKEIKKKYA